MFNQLTLDQQKQLVGRLVECIRKSDEAFILAKTIVHKGLTDGTLDKIKILSEEEYMHNIMFEHNKMRDLETKETKKETQESYY